MVVLQSLKRVPGVIGAAPILFVPALLLMALQVPQLLTEMINPLLASLISMMFSGVMLLVYPFFHGGMIGMTNDTVEDSTSLSRFLEHGKRHYVSLLGAYLLTFALFFVIGIVVAVIGFFGLVAFIASEGSVLVLAMIAVVMLPVVLLYLAIAFAIHFYGHAIVIEGKSALDGLRRSVEVIRENIRPAIGYYLITLVGGGVAGGGYALALLWALPSAGMVTSPSPAVMLAGIALSTILMTVFVTAFLVYSVLVYRSLTVERESGDSRTTDLSGPDPTAD